MSTTTRAAKRRLDYKITSMKRRIVMLGTSRATKGGVGAVIRSYADAGLFERWPITHLTTHVEASFIKKFGVVTVAYARFLGLLVTGRVGLLHVHSASDASFFRKTTFIIPALLACRPFIFHLHGGGFMEFYRERCGPLRRAIVRFVLRRAARVITLSQGWARKITSIVPSVRVLVIPNMVPLTPVAPRLADPGGPVDLLFLGRLEQLKGIYDLLPAFAAVKALFPHIRLLLAGQGEVETVRAKAAALGIEQDVILLGWIAGAQKQTALNQAQLFLLPSYIENMPVSVLEAMAAGLPVIATPVGAVPEIMQEGVTGFIVPPGDVEALARAIGQLVSSAERRRDMGAAGRRLVEEKFSVQKVMPQLEAVYRELYGACGDARYATQRNVVDAAQTNTERLGS